MKKELWRLYFSWPKPILPSDFYVAECNKNDFFKGEILHVRSYSFRSERESFNRKRNLKSSTVRDWRLFTVSIASRSSYFSHMLAGLDG